MVKMDFSIAFDAQIFWSVILGTYFIRLDDYELRKKNRTLLNL